MKKKYIFNVEVECYERDGKYTWYLMYRDISEEASVWCIYDFGVCDTPEDSFKTAYNVYKGLHEKNKSDDLDFEVIGERFSGFMSSASYGMMKLRHNPDTDEYKG